MSDKPAFSIRSLSFSYGKRLAVSCESLDHGLGVAAAVVGPNGSGKSTFLKLLNGLVGPYVGKADFLGRPIPGNRLLRLRSVYLHQHPVLFAGSVRDNLAYPLSLRRVPRAEALAKADAVAARFGLVGLLERRANRLSGGETQRVALARALAAGADVLLLDEPTSSMDAGSDAAVRDILSALKADGCTLLFATHDDLLVRSLADRVYRAADGRIEVRP